MKKLLIILILASNYSFGQVVIDSVAVTATFNGTLNKTILEIYVLNTSENDSAESVIDFNINNNSIVEKLWLEIDNELKSDITLSRTAGTTIYNRIIRKRIDPAYLIKYNDGDYHLRIFPVNKNQRRKVVIEYYSILGGKKEHSYSRTSMRHRSIASKENGDINSLHWFINFQKEPINKSIKLTSVQPRKTILDLSKIDSTQIAISEYYDETFLQNFASKNVDTYSVSLNYEKTNSVTKYKNDSLECYSTNIPFQSDSIYYATMQNIYEYNLSPPDFIKYLIQNSREFKDRTLFLNETRYGCNSFWEDMLNYIKKCKPNEINIEVRDYTNQNNAGIWFYNNGTLVTEELLFSLKPPDESLSKKSVEIESPYVDKFFKYSKILNANLTEQIASGYLTETLAKIVIEDDSLSRSIKGDVLKRERLGTLTPFIESEPVFFFKIDKEPEIIGGLDSVYSKLFFPAFVDSIPKGERIFLKPTVNKAGEIICCNILRSKNETFSQIGSFALNLVEWLPGEHRGKPVTTPVSIPLVFNKDILNTTPNKNYNIDNRNYIATLRNNHLVILEEGFEFTETEEIIFRTESFYNLLFNNPDIINIVYKAMYISNIKKLGFVIKTKDQLKNVLIIKPE